MMEHDLPTIDLTLGTKLTGGKEALAKEMITMLQETLPKDFSNIESAYQTKDYQDLLKQVHRLHGAVSYCGTPALKKAVSELEQHLKDNSLDNLPKLYTMLANAVNDVMQAKL